MIGARRPHFQRARLGETHEDQQQLTRTAQGSPAEERVSVRRQPTWSVGGRPERFGRKVAVSASFSRFGVRDRPAEACRCLESERNASPLPPEFRQGVNCCCCWMSLSPMHFKYRHSELRSKCRFPSAAVRVTSHDRRWFMESHATQDRRWKWMEHPGSVQCLRATGDSTAHGAKKQ